MMEQVPADDLTEASAALEDRAPHRRIAVAIGELHAEARPPGDWQARVLARVRAAQLAGTEAPAGAARPAGAEAPAPRSPRSGARRRSWSPLWLPLGLALPAAAALLVMAPWTARAPELTVELDATSVAPRRSEAPVIGTRVHISATSAAPHRALWVFRGRDELVMSCPGPGCTADDDRLAAVLTVQRNGDYLVVALWSDEPIAPPPPSLDEALAAAARAGIVRRSHRFSVW